MISISFGKLSGEETKREEKWGKVQEIEGRREIKIKKYLLCRIFWKAFKIGHGVSLFYGTLKIPEKKHLSFNFKSKNVRGG